MNLAFVDGIHCMGVDINTDHIQTTRGQNGCCWQTNIT
ncbi:Uncharacterised protein [Vibrio cholerae]|nr:Uncharacterised protein [Vibrio cholerae]